MVIAITGAAGFIGGHVLTAARRRGLDTVGLDRVHAPGDGRWVTAELSVPDPAVDAALGRAAAVIHLAGCPGVRTATPDIAGRRRRDNVEAGRRVIAATPPATPLVVVSSSSVYGGAGDPARPSHEDDPLAPRGGYARSKVALERLAARRRERGGRVLVARPFTVAGPGQRADMAIARWIAALSAGRPARLLGDPGRRRDVTDVRQVADALVRLALRGEEGVVNLGTGTAHRLDDMLAAVARAVGVPVRIDHRPAHPDEVTTTLADPRRCARLLGAAPTTDLDRLVADQVAAGPRPARAGTAGPADAPTARRPDPVAV